MNVLTQLIILSGIGISLVAVAPVEASWIEEHERGSYQDAKHECDSWAFNQGTFAMQDKSYQYLSGDLIKINPGSSYNVPMAFCYHDPDSRTLLGYKYIPIHPTSNRSKKMMDSDLPTWVMEKRFKF